MYKEKQPDSLYNNLVISYHRVRIPNGLVYTRSKEEMPVTQFSDRPFPQALGEILRSRFGDAMGRYPLAPFIAQVQEKTGLTYEYVRLMLRDQRNLRSDVIEATADILGLDQFYFLEQRQMFVRIQMEQSPKLTNELFELTQKYLSKQEAVNGTK